MGGFIPTRRAFGPALLHRNLGESDLPCRIEHPRFSGVPHVAWTVRANCVSGV